MARLGRARPIGSKRHEARPAPLSAVVASDNFNRTENPLSQGGKWTGDFDSPAEANGTHFVSTAFASEGAYRTDIGICNDCAVRAVLGSTITENYLWVRRDPGANNGYCLIAIGGTTMEVYRVTGGSFVRLGASITQAHVTGDVIGLTVEGTLLTVSLNGVYVGERTDANFTSGYLGISSYNGGTFNSFWAADLDVNPIQAPVFLDAEASGGAGTLNFTTAAEIPPGARVILATAHIQPNANYYENSFTDASGLTWTRDILINDTATDFAVTEFWSALCPLGASIGETFSTTFVNGAGTIWNNSGILFYVEGLTDLPVIDDYDYKGVNGNPGNPNWSTDSIDTTNAEDLLVAIAFADGAFAGSSVTAPFTKIGEFFNDPDDWMTVAAYRIVSSTGTYSASGTWNNNPGFQQHMTLAAYEAMRAPVASGDTTSPIITILSGPTLNKISQVSGKDSFDFVWESDEAFTAYKIKSVPAAGSDHTSGTQIEAGGAFAAGADVTSTITDDELVAADPGDEAKIVKVFVQDAAGNWST